MKQTCLLTTKDAVVVILLLFALAVCVIGDATCNTTEAMVFVIKDNAPPEISIHVGSGGPNISLVNFVVPDTEIGNGTPIDSNKKINIHLIIRAPAANPLTGFLTVDSSTPLDNGSGATIPASEISWTARYEDIPSGSFAGTGNQPLASFTSSIRVFERHTFSYANRNIYDAGTYNGQVTYTWSTP